MKTSTRVFGLVAVVASIAVAAYAADTYSLKRVAKVGDTLKYKFSADVDFGGQAAQVTFSTVDKVTKVEDNGNISTESKQENMKVSFGGQEMSPEDQPARTTITKSTGEIVEIKGEMVDGSAYRFSNMNIVKAPEAPVKVGDKWSYEVKADSKTGAVAGKADYEVLAAEKVGDRDTVKIKWTYKETEGADAASSEGTVWMDAKDGAVVKASGSFTKAPIPGAPGPVDMKFTMERVG